MPKLLGSAVAGQSLIAIIVGLLGEAAVKAFGNPQAPFFAGLLLSATSFTHVLLNWQDDSKKVAPKGAEAKKEEAVTFRDVVPVVVESEFVGSVSILSLLMFEI